MRKLVDQAEWLYRRGFSTPERKYMNPDGTATSRVFTLREKDNGELSVDVKSMTTANSSVQDSQKYMLFEIAHVDVLKLNLRAEHDPLPNGQSIVVNPAHAVIVGMKMGDEITPGLLARHSRRVVSFL
jgi:hypothetical protein